MSQMRNSSEDLRALPPRPPTASPKRRFVRLGRKTSDGSHVSVSSSPEGVAIRHPSKSHVRRHSNRLSGVFQRRPTSSPAPMSLTAGLRSTLLVQSRKGSMISTGALVADDPSELSNQITAPGILKIFGNEICEGAHYKSVLATTHSSAKELVKEALERYGLSKEEAESFVLCDTIGTTGSHQWRTEGFRVLGDHEKPLLLQSLWKPREGLARRFEIQKRSSVEEKTSKEKDTVTAGINAQARKLQKSRSRVTSTFIERTVGRSQKLWRSKSEMDLLDSEGNPDPSGIMAVKDQSQTLNQRLEQNGIQIPAARSIGEDGFRVKTESHCPPGPRGEREGEESEREETESSDDNTTQYSIHPPRDCPYLLLLKGCSLSQDFVIYLLVAPDVTIGRQINCEDGSKADILLSASDVLPRHCCLRRGGGGGPTTLCLGQNAVVTRNGELLQNDVQLSAGDVIGLGQHYLFLFKDPLASTPKEVSDVPPEPGLSSAPWMLHNNHHPSAASRSGETLVCSTCMSTCTDLQSSDCRRRPGGCAPPFLSSPEGGSLTLNYEAEHEDRIVKEIVAMGRAGSILDRPPLTVSFLLCMCVQYSAACLQASDLRRLLLLISSDVQSAVWEHTKNLAAVQPEALDGEITNPEDHLSVSEVTAGLRPLVVWMSNGLELLQMVQYQLPLVVEWRVREEQEQEQNEEEEDEERKEAKKSALLELRLSSVRSATDETTAVLEEVVMLAFQQCVYYVTKLLYPILPALLDCNPFRENPEPRGSVQSVGFPQAGCGLRVPGEIRRVLDVLAEVWTLLSDCQVHPEISAQLIGYLFYFINASLFNSLMEKGSEPGFYQWSRGVRMRANLDLLLDWAHAAGLGELALEHTHTLSSAINLLATPRKNLLQSSWATLRSDHPALSPAQLNHLLTLYSPTSPCRHTWTPSAQDQAAAVQTADLLESFDTHHPLLLPDGGYQLQLRRPVTDVSLREQLDALREFISNLRDAKLNVTAAGENPPLKNGCTIQMEGKQTGTGSLFNNSLKTVDASLDEVILSVQTHVPSSAPSVASPPSPPSPSLARHLDEVDSCGASILSQKLRKLELQTRDTVSSELRRSSLDPSCLLTPPNTPHREGPADLMNHEKWMKTEEETLPWYSTVDEGGLVFECLAALKVDRLKSDSISMQRLVELKEEEEEEDVEEEEELVDDRCDGDNDEVFSLELERGENGLGLALVDTRDTSMKVKGVFIRAVVPDSPAARCEKLLPGDRILAVNGVSLLGLDYHSGKELIQSSGARLRLLVARSEWMVEAIRTEC
ncbi:ras-associating and dilute domain-containing protein-like [Salarias fasciatus]|uniref:ras-associating and dilute domain-containing protein-like n=1 Tax=Salarias fasciatus TaxID=181472 RepID=UPI001176D436|nr:ras-associating and dilute domain-containing protein-like [Salarias fasciatus]XP_029953346.1 ras-associating and dilute domain-containing protein-like [Salarias fasciatus]XP_029953347.1 ras-associating and dilute domain-containing protein-like [Salarias fasciatus]